MTKVLLKITKYAVQFLVLFPGSTQVIAYKMLVIRAGIHKRLVRITSSRADLGQITSSESV